VKHFLIRRLIITLPVLWSVATVTFFLLHLVPGDPVDIMLGDMASYEEKQVLRQELGLDRPLAAQYSSFLGNLVRGDLGTSLRLKRPVTDQILSRLPATAELAAGALAIALLLGIPLGVIAAIKQYSITDNSILVLSLIGLSMPAILLGPVLTLIFSLHLGWLPISERGGLENLILPSVTLASGLIAIIARMTRTSMLEVLREDYIQVARSKGLPPLKVLFKHALVNALPPILTITGLLIGALLTGVVVIETLFDWPGIGSLLLDGILQRDYPLVQGCTLFVATVYVVVNMLTDISYAVVNPKVRLDG
jgi:peptide/nickel transport system permease protein